MAYATSAKANFYFIFMFGFIFLFHKCKKKKKKNEALIGGDEAKYCNGVCFWYLILKMTDLVLTFPQNQLDPIGLNEAGKNIKKDMYNLRFTSSS